MSICQRCGAPAYDRLKESSDSNLGSCEEKQVQFADVDAPFHTILLLDLEGDKPYDDEPDLMRALCVLVDAGSFPELTADSETGAWTILRLLLWDESLTN